MHIWEVFPNSSKSNDLIFKKLMANVFNRDVKMVERILYDHPFYVYAYDDVMVFWDFLNCLSWEKPACIMQ